MTDEKKYFLKKEFVVLLNKLKAEEKGKWGKMNAQQIIEHLSEFFRVSTEKKHFPLNTPLEHLPKLKAFLMSEKEFRENTNASFLSEEPLPLQYSNLSEAINILQTELNYFFEFFEKEPFKTTLHPAFGELNFDEWIQLHHKHVTHHLKQFGLI